MLRFILGFVLWWTFLSLSREAVAGVQINIVTGPSDTKDTLTYIGHL